MFGVPAGKAVGASWAGVAQTPDLLNSSTLRTARAKQYIVASPYFFFVVIIPDEVTVIWY